MDTTDQLVVKVSADVSQMKEQLDQGKGAVSNFVSEAGADLENWETNYLDRAFERVTAYFAVYASLDTLKEAIKGSIEASSELEIQMGRTQAVINAMGYSSQVSAQAVDTFARDIEETTLKSAESARGAASILLTIPNMTRQTLEEALQAAANISSVMQIDMTSAARELARALEDPTIGLSMLRREGITFTQEQQNTIKALYESGQAGEAMAKTLDHINETVGGAAAGEAGGIAGKFHELAVSVHDLKEEVGDSGWLRGAAEALAEFATTITKNFTMNTTNPNDWTLAQVEDQIRTLAEARNQMEQWDQQHSSSMWQGQIAQYNQSINEMISRLELMQHDQFGTQTSGTQAPVVDPAKQIEARSQAIMASVADLQRQMELLAGGAAKTWQDALTPIQKYNQGIEELVQEWQAGLLGKDDTLFNQAVMKLTQSFIAADPAAQAVKRGLQDVASTIDNDFTNKVNDLTAAFDAGAISAQDYSDTIAKWNAQLGKADAMAQMKDEAASAKIEFQDINSQLSNLNNFADSIGFTFQSAFEKAVISGNSFRSVIQGLAQDIAQLVLRQTITGPMAQGISQLVQMGSIWAMGGYEPGATDVPSIPLYSWNAGFGGGKASGGPVSADMLYLVGENGPELFRPTTAGTVIPNNQIGSQRGGPAAAASAPPSPPVIINVVANDTQGFDKLLASRGKLLSSIVHQELVKQGKPGVYGR